VNRPQPAPAIGRQIEDWKAVADEINARMAELRVTQQELSDSSGVSVSTIRQLQQGVSGKRRQNRTLHAVARSLGWPEDRLVAVLRGRRPAEPTSADPAEALSRILSELQAVKDGLARLEGRLDRVEDQQKLPSPR
jgi:transcriptional regulator with XRE-family HTH domain